MPKGPIVTAWEAIQELHQVEKSISFMFPTLYIYKYRCRISHNHHYKPYYLLTIFQYLPFYQVVPIHDALCEPG